MIDTAALPLRLFMQLTEHATLHYSARHACHETGPDRVVLAVRRSASSSVDSHRFDLHSSSSTTSLCNLIMVSLFREAVLMMELPEQHATSLLRAAGSHLLKVSTSAKTRAVTVSIGTAMIDLRSAMRESLKFSILRLQGLDLRVQQRHRSCQLFHLIGFARVVTSSQRFAVLRHLVG